MPEYFITGVGVVSSIGVSKNEFWEAINNKKEVFSYVDGNKICQIGEGFLDGIANKFNTDSYDRSSKILLVAAQQAVEDSGFLINDLNTYRCGVSVGATFNCLESACLLNKQALTDSPRFVDPSLFPNTVTNAPASRLSIIFKIKGLNVTHSAACCSFLDALMYGSESIDVRGKDFIIVGGVEDFNENYLFSIDKSNYFDNEVSFIGEAGAAITLESSKSIEASAKRYYAKVIASHSLAGKFTGFDDLVLACVKSMLDKAKINSSNVDLWLINFFKPDVLSMLKEKLNISCVYSPVKKLTGQTFSASSGLDLIYAIGLLNKGSNKMIGLINLDPSFKCNSIVLTK